MLNLLNKECPRRVLFILQIGDFLCEKLLNSMIIGIFGKMYLI